MSDNEKRKHERTPLEVTVDWQELGSDDVIWSATGDVGPGGLKIRTLTPPEQGRSLVVVLGPAETAERLLRVPARVAWVQMDDDFCGMGVAFEPTNDAERDAVKKLLNELTERDSK
ncbi:MAG: PilZ domain-containing protein [bacterium]